MSVLGVDTSYWNGPGNWQITRSRGVRFAFIRAGATLSDGGLAYDEMTARHLTDAKANGILTGLYWYMRPAFDWQHQAQAFISVLNREYPGRWILPPVVDVETSGVSTTTAASRVKAFVNAIIQQFGVNPIIYTRQSIWDSSIARDALWPTLDLWAARYNSSLTGPWSDGKMRFRDWQDWRFWQFSADGNGQGAYYGFSGAFTNAAGQVVYPDKDCDLNYFNGTVEQLFEYAGLEAPPEPEPEPEDWHTAIESWARTLGYSGPTWAGPTE